jgi:hypothetical protein
VTNELTVQSQDPFSEMERMDEQQILDEIKGRAIDSLVYEIRQGGQIITGLSLAGVSEVVRIMNANGKSRLGISEREPVTTENADYFEVKAFAQDTMNGGGYWGIKRQPKVFQKRDGTNQADPFALEKAMAKAQRNALRRLIPEYFAKEMIDAFRQRGRAQVIDNKPAAQSAPRQVSPAQNQPAQDAPSQPVKRTQIKSGLWADAVKELGAMPYYQTKDGAADTYHMLGSAAKIGIAEINDANIAAVKAQLIAHAQAATAMAATENAEIT